MNNATLPTQFLKANGANLAYRHYAGSAYGDLPGILFLGGFQSSMDGEKAQFLTEMAMARGQQVTCFDYRGHGATGGSLDGLGIASWVADAEAILAQVCEGPQILVGSSMGGWVMTLLWRRQPHRFVKLIGIAAAPDFTEDLMKPKLSPEGWQQIQETGSLRIPSLYDDEGYILTKELFDQGAANRVLTQKHDIDIPVELIHGDADPDVPVTQSQKLFDCLNGDNIALKILKGGDHRLSEPRWLRHIHQAVTL